MSIRITVAADSTANLHGHAGAVIHERVLNSGTAPVRVRAFTECVTARARAHCASGWISAIEPRTLKLAPGQSGTVALTVRVPMAAQQYHPTGFVNVVFAAAPVGHGVLRLADAVGGTLKLTHPGVLAGPHITPAPAAGHAGTPSWGIGLAVLAVIVVAAMAAWAVILRHRRNRAGR